MEPMSLPPGDGLRTLAGLRITVLTVSDRGATGERTDDTGPVIASALAWHGARVDAAVIPDEAEQITDAIAVAVADGADAVVTTGGTGVGPRDVTPEATAALIDRDLPGIPELLRQREAARTPLVALSRARAGLTPPPERALLVNLPGSPAAVASALEVLPELIAHSRATSHGGDH